MNDRHTNWRQGSIIRKDELSSLEVPSDEDTLAIVITHDCDLPQSKERQIEVIIGKAVKPDKQLLSARNVRKLHLIMQLNAQNICLELNFQTRVIFPRDFFFERTSVPDENYSISDTEKRIFKQWLSIRYGRPAFPNHFENRLKKNIGKDILEKRIAKLIEPHHDKITGLFISIGEDKYNDLEEGTPYFLSIYIAYKTSGDLTNCREAAEQIENGLKELFLMAFGEDSQEIILENCQALADNKISLSDLLKLDQWRLEWISLSANDEEFLATGQS